ncbi:YicC/YloC family endoribonuclease [Sedimenticola selenatireducens]|uniref:YicC/YloC family endoribonuclease n=1 Tax=Sedimenticola selenatireducens TaxID=191960 RepID=UPI0004B45B8A|nr:YicC/YloC family endoribonuclease [Sedimenticola selenatireducens]
MTSFSRRESRDELGELVCELRSVNHRYLELFVRLPEELRALEPLVRERVAARLGRGKVDCLFRFVPSKSATAGVAVNERFAQQIIDAAGEVGLLLHESVPPRAIDILRWPGVLETEELDLTPVHKRAAALLDETLDGLVESRHREGGRLAELIIQRCGAMREEVAKVKQLMPQLLVSLRDRLRARLAELTAELDEGRIEQEMVLLTQRLDVDEEMDRLQTHLDEVEAVLARDEPVGRRLDFLMQELNREANTLGSKSNDVEMTRVSVELKVLIEQMREQIQNIE